MYFKCFRQSFLICLMASLPLMMVVGCGGGDATDAGSESVAPSADEINAMDEEAPEPTG